MNLPEGLRKLRTLFAAPTAAEAPNREAAIWAIRLFLGREADDDTSTADLPVPTAAVERICGRYRPLRGWNSNLRWRNEYGRWAEIRAQDGQPSLWSKRGPFAAGVPLRLASPDDELFWVGTASRLGAPVPVRLRFEADESGRVNGFRGAAHSHVVMSR